MPDSIPDIPKGEPPLEEQVKLLAQGQEQIWNAIFDPKTGLNAKIDALINGWAQFPAAVDEKIKKAMGYAEGRPVQAPSTSNTEGAPGVGKPGLMGQAQSFLDSDIGKQLQKWIGIGSDSSGKTGVIQIDLREIFGNGMEQQIQNTVKLALRKQFNLPELPPGATHVNVEDLSHHA